MSIYEHFRDEDFSKPNLPSWPAKCSEFIPHTCAATHRYHPFFILARLRSQVNKLHHARLAPSGLDIEV